MADEPEPANNRTDQGRFAPGASGNPNGRPAGVPNKLGRLTLTKLAEAEPQLVEKAIAMALGGSEPIMRALLSALVPVARHEASLAGVELPAMTGAKDLPLLTAAILGAVVDGRLSLPDVLPALEIVKTTATAISVGDHDVRLAQLERLIEQRRLQHGN